MRKSACNHRHFKGFLGCDHYQGSPLLSRLRRRWASLDRLLGCPLQILKPQQQCQASYGNDGSLYATRGSVGLHAVETTPQPTTLGAMYDVRCEITASYRIVSRAVRSDCRCHWESMDADD